MKGLAELIKTTLIGGLLVVLPIYLSILLLAKLLASVLALLSPVTAAIPASAQFRQVVAIVIVLAVCLVVGAPGPHECRATGQERLRALGAREDPRLYAGAGPRQTDLR